MTTTYTIKCKSNAVTSGLTLTGNILTGDTYPVKHHISTIWGGKWDASRKAWIVDSEKVLSTIKNGYSNFTRLLSIEESTPTAAPAKVSSINNGICPKCHTWCYGDCEAN